MIVNIYQAVSNFTTQEVVLQHPFRMLPETGPYVRYGDYQKLSGEIAQLKEQISKLIPMSAVKESLNKPYYKMLIDEKIRDMLIETIEAKAGL